MGKSIKRIVTVYSIVVISVNRDLISPGKTYLYAEHVFFELIIIMCMRTAAVRADSGQKHIRNTIKKKKN